MTSDADKEPKPISADAAADETFLHRWSRRKHEACADADSAPVVTDAAPTPTLSSEQPMLTDADMPPIESLGEDSDYGPFMSSGVSDALRRQALRKLFTLPSVNQREVLNSEYYDCHGFEPLGSIVTHEMKEEMEREAQKLKETLKASLLQTDDVERSPVVTAALSLKQEGLTTPTQDSIGGEKPADVLAERSENVTPNHPANRKLTKRLPT